MAEHTAAVIVATYNRPSELQRLVDGLSMQDVAPLEVIVVDDESTPPAAPVFPESPDTTWRCLRQPNGGPGAARHAGIAAASCDVIVIIDDDMIVTSRFVAAHLEAHAAGADVVQGRFTNRDRDDRPLFDRFVQQQQNALFERCSADPSAFEPVRLSTGNVSFRRQLYADVGGFDLSLRRREDSELGIRFAAAGARFGFCAESTAVHDEPPESLDSWLQVAFEYGESEQPIAERHPEAYQPWQLLDDMPTVVRLPIRMLRGRPPLLRGLGKLVSFVALAFARVRLSAVAVQLYGMAFAFHWFAGMSAAFNAAGRDLNDTPVTAPTVPPSVPRNGTPTPKDSA